MSDIEAGRTPSPDGDPVIDVSVLEQLEETIGRDSVRGLVLLFCDEVPARIEALRAAGRRRALADVKRIAHDWIADAGTLGAMAMARFAREIDTAARAGDETVLERLPLLEEHARRASDAFRRRLAETP